MTKSVRSRLKTIIANRRQARRYQTRRGVALIAAITFETGAGAELITGRTRDVTETGLSLSLPIHDKQQQELMKVNASIRVVLALPGRKINLSATIIHKHLLEVTDPNRGMLVGLQIAQIAAEDQQAYKEYVASLKENQKPGRKRTTR
jgi:hypothetical protein